MFQSRMNEAKCLLVATAVVLLGSSALARENSQRTSRLPQFTPVLADTSMLQELGAEILATQPETGVSYARLSLEQQAKLAHLAHKAGKCGGFEALPPETGFASEFLVTRAFGQLAEREAKNRNFRPQSMFFSAMAERPEITQAVASVSAANLRSTVEFLSSFPDRFHRGRTPNRGVDALKSRIEEAVRGARLPVEVELISHTSTQQKSIRARIVGSRAPNEIIVLGGHLDSITQDWMNPAAPGADDNASGSSNILEALRIVANQAQPERTLEFFWYAGEEGGLLGSAEIARTYKSQRKDVIAVLQLDMTLFPGSGEFVLGSMTDFTSAWLRSYLENLNGLYLHARIVNDQCGYGCSDHASWNRQGYPALMPFEATFDGMNHNLHSSHDVIDAQSNFNHSAMFGKLAVAIAMDLGNSTLREP